MDTTAVTITPLNHSVGSASSRYLLGKGGESHPLLKAAKHKDRSGEEVEKPANIFQRCYRSYFAEAEGDAYVDVLLKANPFVRALRFFPALFITFAIELGNSFVLENNQDVLSKHFTLVLFIPVISAIAGNIGLQTSSSNFGQKAILSAQFNMIVLSAMMGGLADIWKSRHSHGIIVLVGSMVNMLIAAVAGVGTPILLNAFGYDPSSGAGPFETALQDVVGAVFFVYFARWVLSLGAFGCVL